MKNDVYLDYMSTTPLHPEVASAMMDVMKSDCLFANPSSTNHSLGLKARAVIENCRHQMLQALDMFETHKLYFTSGATESINIALKGASQFYQQSLSQVIYCDTDHKAVIESARSIDYLDIQSVGVDELGHIKFNELEKLLQKGIALVNITLVNNEIGTLQDIEKILILCKKYGAITHVDGAQIVGKIQLPCHWLNQVDYMSLSAHKFYGPKGSGALLVKKGRRLTSPVQGGGQEEGIRSGTLSLHQIVGIKEALIVAIRDYDENIKKVCELYEIFSQALLSVGCEINGGGVPHNLNFIVPRFVDMDKLHGEMSGFAYSQGSACTTLQAGPSHVLSALGRESDQIARSIRISLSHLTSQDQVNYFLAKIRSLVK